MPRIDFVLVQGFGLQGGLSPVVFAPAYLLKAASPLQPTLTGLRCFSEAIFPAISLLMVVNRLSIFLFFFLSK